MNDQACLEGLDETGFVMGTSSSLFNVRFISAWMKARLMQRLDVANPRRAQGRIDGQRIFSGGDTFIGAVIRGCSNPR